MNGKSIARNGKSIARAREQLGLSQRDLSKLASVSRCAIWKLESGQIPNPRPATLKAISDALAKAGKMEEET